MASTSYRAAITAPNHPLPPAKRRHAIPDDKYVTSIAYRCQEHTTFQEIAEELELSNATVKMFFLRTQKRVKSSEMSQMLR